MRSCSQSQAVFADRTSSFGSLVHRRSDTPSHSKRDRRFGERESPAWIFLSSVHGAMSVASAVWSLIQRYVAEAARRVKAEGRMRTEGAFARSLGDSRPASPMSYGQGRPSKESAYPRRYGRIEGVVDNVAYGEARAARPALDRGCRRDDLAEDGRVAADRLGRTAVRRSRVSHQSRCRRIRADR